MNKTAVQLFADVLEGDNGKPGSGDVKKLLANMSKSKYELKDIVKVLDSLESRINKDSLAKMLNRPTAELNELHTATTRFFEELNREGALNVIKGGLNVLTSLMKELTKAIKPVSSVFKTTFGNAFEYISGFAGVLKGVFFNSLTSSLITMGGLVLVFNKLFYALYRIIPLLGKKNSLLRKTVPLADKAAKYMGMFWDSFLVPTAIFAEILILEDLLAAVMGKESVIANLAKEDGFIGTLSASLLSFFQLASTIGQVITSGIIEGDWDLANSYVNDFFDNIKNQFPLLTKLFETISDKFKDVAPNLYKAAGMVINPILPTTLLDNLRKVSESNQMDSVVNANMATPNYGFMDRTLNTIPAPSPLEFTANITLNGVSGDANEIVRIVTDQLDNYLNMASANYSNLVMRR